MVKNSLWLAFFVLLCVISVKGTEINFNFAGMIPAEPCCGDAEPCEKVEPCETRAFRFEPTRPSPFADLTGEEYLAIRDFLQSKPELNLTAFSLETTKLSDNYIKIIELLPPSKADVLAYEDEDGPFPERYARVVIFRGAVPDVVEYKVGPLPNPTSYTPIVYYGHPIPFNARGTDDLELWVLWDEIMLDFASQIEDIMAESFGGYTYSENCTKCLIYYDTGPRSLDGSKRQTWFWWVKDIEGSYINPVGLELLLDNSGNDPSLWEIIKIIYNGVGFDSVAELREAYENGGVAKIRLHGDDYDESWSTFQPRGERSFSDKIPGPRHYEPAGKRFRLTGNKVEYYGWEFEFNNRQTAGLGIFNVHFKGERIIYEASIQDAFASYSGASATQSRTVYYDSNWGMGKTLYELKSGVDCPETAAFVDLLFWEGNGYGVQKNALCVFEQDLAFPLRKHYVPDFNWYDGARASGLVMRLSTTVFNYDYIIDFIFYPHGVVEVKAGAGGYIQAGFYRPEESPYATRVGDYIIGTIHDHFFSLKVDIDVAGTANSFQTLNVVREEFQSPWFDQIQVQKRIERHIVQNEDESQLNYDFNVPKYLAFINSNVTNRWGEPKGYRIQTTNFAPAVAADNIVVGDAGEWLRHQVTITRQHDNEQYVSLHYVGEGPIPGVSLKDYLDGENLVQEDLVAWVTVGLVHIPHSEDVPTQPPIGNFAHLFIRPLNYFDEDPSMSVYSAIAVKDDENGVPRVVYDGRPKVEECVPVEKEIPYEGHRNIVE